MRYVATVLCILATACAGATPSSPSASSFSSSGANIAAITGTRAMVQAKGGSAVPLKGDLQATETVTGTRHHLVGDGHGTQIGGFTYTADITVDDETGDGAGTAAWTAANGDQIFANTTGGILVADFPNGRITIGEAQVITGGTGRFSGASGAIHIERALDLESGVTAGSFSGAIDLAR
jgi:hypothetical protein